jgi:hypothetical protein
LAVVGEGAPHGQRSGVCVRGLAPLQSYFPGLYRAVVCLSRVATSNVVIKSWGRKSGGISRM